MSYNNNSLLEKTCNDEQLMRQDIREAIELGLHMNLDNDLEVEIMLKGKMHQIMIDKWNLQITRVNEIIASRPVGQAMPAIGCYQFHPCSSSPCLAVKTTHDNWYNDIRQLFNCEKRFFIETKLQKGLRINPVVGAGHIAMISTATKLRYFLEDTLSINRWGTRNK